MPRLDDFDSWPSKGTPSHEVLIRRENWFAGISSNRCAFDGFKTEEKTRVHR